MKKSRVEEGNRGQTEIRDKRTDDSKERKGKEREFSRRTRNKETKIQGFKEITGGLILYYYATNAIDKRER